MLKNTSVLAHTIFFKNGKLYKTIPENSDNWYDAHYVISDGIRYDLDNVQSIRSIKIPHFQTSGSFSSYSITNSLDYVLRMKAGNFYNAGLKELCSACLWKSTELMLANKSAGWKKNDYNRLIDWHNQLRMFDEADRAKRYLSSYAQYTENIFDSSAQKIRDSVFAHAQQFNCDLVVFHDYSTGCCAECAKYRGRVYSISGKSFPFPKLPEYARLHGNFHPKCRCSMSLYLDKKEKIFYKGNRVNPIRASLRPWKDDRDAREKQIYQEYLERIKKEEYQEQSKEEYNMLVRFLPELAPKSLSAYNRMKNFKTKDFLQLAESAKLAGIKITL